MIVKCEITTFQHKILGLEIRKKLLLNDKFRFSKRKFARLNITPNLDFRMQDFQSENMKSQLSKTKCRNLNQKI